MRFIGYALLIPLRSKVWCKSTKYWLSLFGLTLCILIWNPVYLCGLSADTRGGIVFSLENADLSMVGNDQYLSIDVMVSSPDQSQRLGTGIVLLNYNPSAFGQNVRSNNHVIVSRGALITTSPFPFYSMIINDNAPTRLAVTYEYTVGAGYGGLLSSTPQHLLNIKFKVLNTGFPAGISFQQSMMTGEQYLDDNSTLFSQVLAADIENSILPSTPTNIALTASGGTMSLSWDRFSGCTYSVYSAEQPESLQWLLEVSGLTEPTWNFTLSEERMFFRVIAIGNPGTIRKGVE